MNDLLEISLITKPRTLIVNQYSLLFLVVFLIRHIYIFDGYNFDTYTIYLSMLLCIDVYAFSCIFYQYRSVILLLFPIRYRKRC